MKNPIRIAVAAFAVFLGAGIAVARADATPTLHGKVGVELSAPAAQPFMAATPRPAGYVRNPAGCSSYMVEGQARGSCAINSTTRGRRLRLVNQCWSFSDERTNWILGQGIAIYAATGTCGASAAHFWEMS